MNTFNRIATIVEAKLATTTADFGPVGYYVLHNGNETTRDQIIGAFERGQAVLIQTRGNNHTKTGLMLDGQHRDTRGECYSMWEETWTATPDTAQQALNAAKVRF